MAKRKLSKHQQRRIADKQTKNISNLDTSNAFKGTVISHHGRELVVETSELLSYNCKLQQNLGDIACGDEVAFILENDGVQGVIIAIHERKNLLTKTGFGGKKKSVAANMDQIVVVCALKPEPNLFLIDRYIISAENMGATPVIVLNKFDLTNEENEKYLNTLKEIYEPIGYEVIVTSAKNNHGFDPLEEALTGHTSILVGLSGVGKSKISNLLIPGTNTRVGKVSEATSEGKHTTTVSTLYHLPKGGNLIDSPGVRDFTPTIETTDELLNGFVELREFKNKCKFSNCTHASEPGCAILNALLEKKISQTRSDSFMRLQSELLSVAP